MKKRNLLITLCIIIFGLITITSCLQQEVSAATNNQSQKRQIPTLFFHGFGGTVHSMDYLIDQSQADGFATRTLTIFVHLKES